MSGARVLILEDDPHWIQTVTAVLESVAGYVVSARSLAEARATLERCYFNVAVVDVSLRLHDPRDSQGMAFLKSLHELHLEETVRPIVLSAYGDMDRVRDAFRDYHVVDFLVKAPFDPEALVQAVQRALVLNNLHRAPDIEVAGGGGLRSLWGPFTWARRHEPSQLEAELHDLLCRLFPGAERLFIDRLPAGQSGAGVLEVDPVYGYSAGAPVVVKFGKRDKIEQEQANYRRFIEPYVGAHSSTQLRHVSGRVMGAICYRLIGTELEAVTTFADFYTRHDVDAVNRVLDNLLRDACGRWYDNREQPRQKRDLVALYVEGLHMVWDEVWSGAAAASVDLGDERMAFPGVEGWLVNPRRWLEAHGYQVHRRAWRAVTHGDLNEYNVLIGDDGRCWLIDFYRSGWGHILRDVVELETAIKFNLTPVADLGEYRQLEAHLLGQIRIDRPHIPPTDHPHHKPLAVIGHLRGLADDFTGHDRDMVEYNAGLLLTTLKYLSLEQIDREQRQKALLSAALLCQALDGQVAERE